MYASNNFRAPHRRGPHHRGPHRRGPAGPSGPAVVVVAPPPQHRPRQPAPVPVGAVVAGTIAGAAVTAAVPPPMRPVAGAAAVVAGTATGALVASSQPVLRPRSHGPPFTPVVTAHGEFDMYLDHDTFAGKNAMRVHHEDTAVCMELCRKHHFGGFVHWKGQTYFRSQQPKALRGKLRPVLGAVAYIFRRSAAPMTAPAPAPAAESTVVVVAPPAPAPPAPASAPVVVVAPPRRPAAPFVAATVATVGAIDAVLGGPRGGPRGHPRAGRGPFRR